MPIIENEFTITLKTAHLEWGVLRHTNSRGLVYGEGYIPIPAKHARRYSIYNSNLTTSSNIYLCDSNDGYLKQVQLKASGSSHAGNIYAKQFQGNGNLQLLGQWFSFLNAQAGDFITVRFVNIQHILLTHIPQ